jgi:hypothetical protein
MLPNEEDAVRDEVKATLADELDACWRLLDTGVHLPIDNAKNGSKISPLIHNVAVPLFVKACGQFRAAIALAQLARTKEVDVLNRCLFETVLALQFILRRRVTLCRVSEVPNATGKTRIRRMPLETHGKTLTSDFRAAMYVVHVANQAQRMADTCSRSRWFRHEAKLYRALASNPLVDECRTEIGADWVERLRKKKSYSGVTIRDLAHSFDPSFRQWYDLVYSRQSQTVHAADAMQFVDVTESESLKSKWHSSPDEVKHSLYISHQLFKIAMSVLHRRFDFGWAESQLLSQLSWPVPAV